MRIELPELAIEYLDIYLQPTDLVWRPMEGISIRECYHVAVYLGNSRVTHIGSSKFIKSVGNILTKTKSDKALMGARNEHWKDFLHGANEVKLIRYHPIIPFQRPEKIQANLTNAILSEYGAKNYNFFNNNCEHFATLCVTGIPFSTQADKISLLLHKVHWNLQEQMLKSEEIFSKMPNSKAFKENIRKLKLKEIKELKSQTELTTTEQEKLTNLDQEVQALTTELEEKLIPQEIIKLNQQGELTNEIHLNLIQLEIELKAILIDKLNESKSKQKSSEEEEQELIKLTLELAELKEQQRVQSWWKQIIETSESSILHSSIVHGTIIEIIPLKNNENQVIVINKVVLYSVHLLEYKDNELTELKKSPKHSKLHGYTLERAQQKAKKLKDNIELNLTASISDDNSSQYSSVIEVPTNN